MTFQSINPYSGEVLAEIPVWNDEQLEAALSQAAAAAYHWQHENVDKRGDYLRRAAVVLRQQKETLARTVTLEMGKLLTEAEAEVEKCAWVCEYYAENAGRFLDDQEITTDAQRSFVAFQPLGTVLAIMPWNFPLWQVFRFAAPALMAGNTGVLKHASNVPQCALALEKVFEEAGLPEGVFRSLMIKSNQVERVIADERVHAVTLTGSESAGRSVASLAGRHLKKTVLELGGSDAFIVLDDADLQQAVQGAVISRFLNAGQSCIAAKRFIVTESVADEFVERFKQACQQLVMGDPLEPGTKLAPMARQDLRNELHQQVATTLQQGGKPVTGCSPVEEANCFYPPSIIDHVKPGMLAFDEELFGPVASVIRVKNEEEALRVANGSRYGLGGSVWTQDIQRGEAVARRVACGACFVNGFVKSDPRLPFGGIKASGYGRELAHWGMHEFVNVKTVWIG
jgi:succinate-semialdehyde dehydrogenase/glutarate-semialdehyde dehydrogenase